MLKGLIFDLDGTLIDSHKYIWPSFEKLLGIKLTDEDIQQALGLPLKDFLKVWGKKYGIKPLEFREFSKKSADNALALMRQDNNYNSGLHNLLQNAKRKEMKIAIATSSTRWRADQIIDILEIRSHLDYLVTTEDVTNNKPHPEIFLTAAQAIGVSPSECLVFEDAISGLTAAKRAGMKSIAMKTEYCSQEDLKDASRIITSFSDITLQQLYVLF
jgi:HAD superfamily hydrolase (TIGR01509 family)